MVCLNRMVVVVVLVVVVVVEMIPSFLHLFIYLLVRPKQACKPGDCRRSIHRRVLVLPMFLIAYKS